MRDQYWNDLLSRIDDHIVERRCIAILISEFHVSPMLQKQLDHLSLIIIYGPVNRRWGRQFANFMQLEFMEGTTASH